MTEQCVDIKLYVFLGEEMDPSILHTSGTYPSFCPKLLLLIIFISEQQTQLFPLFPHSVLQETSLQPAASSVRS